MEIILHLGAHKTATTFVQKVLAKNRRILAGAGVFAPDIVTIRNIVTKGLGKRPKLVGDFAGLFPPELAFDQARGTLVLSDENITGYPGRVFTRGLFYDDALQRFQRLRRWLPQDPVRILFTIRPYESFFPSAYAQWLGSNRVLYSRTETQLRILELARGWPDVVADIGAAFPESEILVSAYRRDAGFLADQFSRLLGPLADSLGYAPKFDWNKSLSAKSVLQLESLLAGGKVDNRAMALLRGQNDSTAPRLGESFWTADQRKFLRRRYRRDCAELAKQHAGFTPD